MLELVYIFIVGLVFGSFYTVVGLRIPVGESILKPASHCDNCHQSLKWYELIPLVSYIISFGKCRNCNTKIPAYYFIVELLCGTLFALCYFLYGISYEFCAGIIISSVLIIILISDFKYLVILDSPLVIGTILIIGLKYCYFGSDATIKSLTSAFLMFMFLLMIKFVFDRVYKRESLGGGDIKLSLLSGATLGIKLGLASLIVASFLAFPYAIYIIKKHKEKEIPFGPFLAGSLFLTFIFTEPIAKFISTFFLF